MENLHLVRTVPASKKKNAKHVCWETIIILEKKLFDLIIAAGFITANVGSVPVSDRLRRGELIDSLICTSKIPEPEGTVNKAEQFKEG